MARQRRYGAVRQLVHFLLALCLASPGLAARPAPLIWAFGDSLTAGYGLPPAQGFTTQLQAALRQAGVAATVRNGGISGDTAAQARARLLWGLRGLGAAPDLVIVELGANDMLRGLPPEAAAANLDAIVAELKRRRIPTLIAGMKAAPNLGSAYRRSFDAIYPRLSHTYGVRLYPFFLQGVAGRRALLQADGLHPSAAGVTIIVRSILPSVLSSLR
ncbi:MAG: arylesterase [Sphingomonadaceae bacterium]|nr:arylesterase [Sphingomonadaceae bacterium]